MLTRRGGAAWGNGNQGKKKHRKHYSDLRGVSKSAPLQGGKAQEGCKEITVEPRTEVPITLEKEKGAARGGTESHDRRGSRKDILSLRSPGRGSLGEGAPLVPDGSVRRHGILKKVGGKEASSLMR